jgi:dCTP diphosphatase
MLRRLGIRRNVTVPTSAGLLRHTRGYFYALTAYRTVFRSMSSGVIHTNCYLDVVADKSLHDELQTFVTERDWAQFHSPANLAKSISIEAAELLECFQWSDDADKARVTEKLAAVLTYCLLLANRLGVDPDQIVREKLALTRDKYRVDKARGRSTKYDAL